MIIYSVHKVVHLPQLFATKLRRVYGNSATLIGNIFTNKSDVGITKSTILSNIFDF